MPVKALWKVNDDSYYTLVFYGTAISANDSFLVDYLSCNCVVTDLDSPKANEAWSREFLLWLVINIKGSDVRLGRLRNGITVAEYLAPRTAATRG